jgi:phosphonate transport system substrate-binding protein
MLTKNILLRALPILLYISLTVPLQAEEYKLSMLPRYFPEKLNSMITPLATYLSSQTGNKITTILTANFDKYEVELKNGAIAIGYENPLVYVNISDAHEVLATAIKGPGEDKFRGIIVIRPDSGIKSIADLAGKQIMIVGKTSAGGYLSQKLTLQKEKVPLDAQLLAEAADNRQENVLIAVSIGDVDAGFIRESALHKADKYIIPGSIKVLAQTAWLPNWAFSVSRNLPDEQKIALRDALLALKKESKEMKAMGLTGFKAAADSDYDIIRKLTKP